MKRIMTLCLLIVMTVGGVKAQKGMQGVGVNLGVTFFQNGSPGLGVKYQYNVSNYFRIEPSFSWYFVDDGYSNGEDENCYMSALLNANIFFSSPRTIRPYCFVGLGALGMELWKWKHDVKDNDSVIEFGLDAGLGIDWRITHQISLQVEAGMLSAIDNSPGFKANLGLSYNF